MKEAQKAASHGHCRRGKMSPTYNSWQSMRKRCNNPNDPSYSEYGAKGITICKEWDRFELFLADMGERPQGTTLHRKNNKMGYSPSNCVWADTKTQAIERKGTIWVTIEGRTQCLADWAEEYEIKMSTVQARIYRMKWSPEKALTTPLLRKKTRR